MIYLRLHLVQPRMIPSKAQEAMACGRAARKGGTEASASGEAEEVEAERAEKEEKEA